MRGLALLVSICVASGCGGYGLATATPPSNDTSACLPGAECRGGGGTGELVIPLMILAAAAATVPVVLYKLAE